MTVSTTKVAVNIAVAGLLAVGAAFASAATAAADPPDPSAPPAPSDAPAPPAPPRWAANRLAIIAAKRAS